MDEAVESPPCEGSCGCGDPSGGDCSGAVGLHDAVGCAGQAERSTTETCEPFGASLSFVSFNYPAGATVTTEGLCVPSARAVAPGQVTTLCCAESL